MLNEIDICETVRIVSSAAPGGFVVINKSDLKDGDVLYGEEVKKPTNQKGPQSRGHK